MGSGAGEPDGRGAVSRGGGGPQSWRGMWGLSVGGVGGAALGTAGM